MPSEVEIGVWVEGLQKWVTGVTRRTTCHDIIKALLRAQNLQENSFDINDYVIVERWRKVERPLEHEQRILKVWRTWGEAVQEVQFTLRRLRNEEDKMSVESGSRLERSRRRHKLRQTNSKAAQVNKKLTKDGEGTNDTMDRLMRLVVAQGETIQTQLRRMHERDQQIEVFEQQMHQLRVRSLGSNYLLQSYLRETLQEQANTDKNFYNKDDVTCEEHSNDSGVVAEELLEEEKKGSIDIEELQARTLILTKLDSVLHTLVEYEEQLSKLEESLAESSVKGEASELKDEIQNACLLHASTVNQVRQNDQQLRELDTLLYQKRVTLDQLLEEDLKYEKEVLALQAHLDHIIHLPPTAFQLPVSESSETFLMHSKGDLLVKNSQSKDPSKELVQPPPPPLPSSSPPPLDDEKDSGKMDSSASSDSAQSTCDIERTKVSRKCGVPSSSPKDSDATDSNSDTGLSSLHSSSDEGVYVLDTLV